MNGGSGSNIEVFKPFGEAFELMKKILFQPFDVEKWFLIGFAAWLAHLGAGSYNFNFDREDWKDAPIVQSVRDWLSGISTWVLILGLGGLFLLIVIIMVVFAWLRARGRFMFIDCIVKNRGAIVQPWREFRAEGNSYFLFGLVVGLTISVIATFAGLPFIIPVIHAGSPPHLNDVYMLSMLALWVVVMLLFVFAWVLISHFMVAVMYRQRCKAAEGFRLAISLIRSHPGEITLYCLFWIALTIASGMASCLVVLATCCIAIIPYLGTVIMLPILVCLRAFGLRFIRQFGPDYDVWAESVEHPPSQIPPPLPI